MPTPESGNIAAIQILGAEHPVMAPRGTPGCFTVCSVRAALQRHVEATRNMRQGNFFGTQVHWASKPQVSPSGRHCAVCFDISPINSGIWVYNAASGQQTVSIHCPDDSGTGPPRHIRWSCIGEELRFVRTNLGGDHEVHRAHISETHSKLQHTFGYSQWTILDLSPHGQFIKMLAPTVSGIDIWVVDFESSEKVLKLPRTTGTCWHIHDGAIAYTQWVGAVDRAWDVHAVCLRTKAPLFTCSGRSGRLVLAAYAPGSDIVGFLKQKHGQQQAILGMATKGGGHTQLEVIYDSQMALDNISPAPNNQYMAFHESEADAGCGVIVCADTKAICYRTAASHLHARQVNWRAAWSADSKWVIWYVSMTRNRLCSPCLLVNVATWHGTQLFSTTDSIRSVVWNRDFCSVLAQTCDRRLCYDVSLLSFVRLPQSTTSKRIRFLAAITGTSL